MKNFVPTSLVESMYMTAPREAEVERYSGNYIPSELRDRFSQMMTPRQKRRKHAEELIQNALIGKFRTVEELENYQDAQENDWVLRSADGTQEILLFDGDLVSKEDINELKVAYKSLEDVNYLDSRPITLRRWRTLPYEYKLSSRRNSTHQ